MTARSKRRTTPNHRDFRWALDRAEPRPDRFQGTRDEKKNYAQRLSNHLAILIAGALRTHFPTVLPDSEGKGSESRARTSKGFKKLDVNYSTLELGLGLGVSVKTINFPSLKKKTKAAKDGQEAQEEVVVGRYTKNYTRADNELRAESQDYHLRQPYAVMVAVIFIPADSMRQPEEQKPREGAWSSFAQAVRIFRHRAGREGPKDVEELFERVFIGVYEHEEHTRGEVWFFDVTDKPRQFGPPRRTLSFEQLIGEIVRTYDDRNNPPFEWDLNGNGGSEGQSPTK